MLGLSLRADNGARIMTLAMPRARECERGKRCRMWIVRCWSRCCGFLSVPTGAGALVPQAGCPPRIFKLRTFRMVRLGCVIMVLLDL